MDDEHWSEKWIKKHREKEGKWSSLTEEQRQYLTYAEHAAHYAMNGNISPLLDELKNGIPELPLRLRYALVALLEGEYQNTDYALILKPQLGNKSSFLKKEADRRYEEDLIYQIHAAAEEKDYNENGQIKRGYVQRAKENLVKKRSLEGQTVTFSKLEKIWDDKKYKATRAWLGIVYKLSSKK